MEENAGEYVSFTEAQKLLGVSQTKLTRLVEEMKWTVYLNRLDKRIRMLKRVDVLTVLTPLEEKKDA